MDCKHVNDHLIDYLYQEMEPDQLDRIEEHIKGCEMCAAELATFDATRNAMRNLPELEPPPALGQLLMREAALAVAPAQEPGFWERLRAGLRMLVMHPAMTAATVLIVVLGISFYVYQVGGPPTPTPRGDDLPPVPPPTATTTASKAAPAGAQATESTVGEAVIRNLREQERGGRYRQDRATDRAADESAGLRVADNNKPGTLEQGLEGTKGAAGGLAKAAPLPVAADPSARQNEDYDDGVAKQQGDTVVTAQPRRRARQAKPRRRVARRPAARSTPDTVYRKGPARGWYQKPSKPAPAKRAFKNAPADDLAGADLWAKDSKAKGKKRVLGKGSSLGSSDRTRGRRYAQAPPAIKPKPRPRPRPSPRPSPEPAPQAAAGAEEVAKKEAGTADKRIKAPKTTTRASRAQDASYLVSRGDEASKAGKCELALHYYNLALSMQPKLAKRVAGRVQRCVTVLGRDGADRLAKAQKRYPTLARWFRTEVARQRKAAAERKAEAKRKEAEQQRKARADKEGGAPYTGKSRASKRRKAKARKRTAPAQAAPTAK
jgi:hypothetical protein